MKNLFIKYLEFIGVLNYSADVKGGFNSENEYYVIGLFHYIMAFFGLILLPYYLFMSLISYIDNKTKIKIKRKNYYV